MSIGQTWHEVIKLTATDSDAYDLFGISVSISGDRAVVGTRDDDDFEDSGSAYIFELLDGVWTETQKLTDPNPGENDLFGNSVSIFGDRLAIGAYGDDYYGSNVGSTFIYELEGGTWTLMEQLIASDAESDDLFGSSGSLFGDRVLIGAYRDEDAGLSSGSTYIFELTDGIWTEVDKLTPLDAADGDFFGYSVSLFGDKALIGAYKDEHVDGLYCGSAYVFELVDGTWVEVEKLIASDASTGDRFGWSVSLSGDKAIIGANGNDDFGPYTGSAYIFEKVGDLWVEVEKLTASDAAAEDFFGSSVSISGDIAIVGSPEDDIGDYDHSGTAYIFELVGGVWTEVERLTAIDHGIGDAFGMKVSISGDQAIIGAPLDGLDRGSAYIFEVCEPPPPVTANADDSEVCFGDEVTLTGSGAATYSWDGDVTNGVPFTPEIGTTTYTVTGVDDMGCGNSDSISVTVNALPEVTAIADDSIVCLGDEVILFGGGAETYTWDGGVLDSEAFEPEIGTTTFTVTGIDTEGCQNTASIEITVLEAISISYITTDEMFGDDASINITVAGGVSPYTFDWSNDGLGDFDDDEDLAGISAGTYIVEIMGEEGCAGTDTIFVDAQLGIGVLNVNDILVYPNPARGTFFIEMEEVFVYSLIDVSGIVLFTENATNKALVDLSELSNGVYFVQISTESRTKLVKLIKQ